MDEKKYKLICYAKEKQITQERIIEKMFHLDLTQGHIFIILANNSKIIEKLILTFFQEM